MTENASANKVICREIREEDLDGVADLLTKGFTVHDRAYWRRACDRLVERDWPEGYARFGWMLEYQNRIVGSIFTIYTTLHLNGKTETRCSTSSWFVEPEFRGHGMRLARQTVKHKDVTYINPTPGGDLSRIYHHLGYVSYCKGHFLALAVASRSPKKVRIHEYASAGLAAAKLKPEESALLADHSEYGCLSLICETADAALPFVFLSRQRYLPYAQLIYCRSQADIVQYAGPIGRYLLRRGMPLIAIDCDGPIPGLFGRFMDGKPKFFRGQQPPRLGDLAYTELAFFAK